MPARTAQDDLPTLDLADLTTVTGGAGMDMSSMMLPMMMMRNKHASAAPPPAAAAVPSWTPKIMVDGVQQQPTQTADGASFANTVDG